MAKARAIVKRLKAVRNIKKITRTMELVATAKFKKAMERALEATAYTRKLAEIVADVSASLGESGEESAVSHPLLAVRPQVKKRLLLVITSNRGLCGGYNAGVLRVAGQLLRSRDLAVSLDMEVSGKRGINFYKFQRQPVVRTYTQFEDKPTFAQIEEIANRIMDQYIAGEIDQFDVAFMQFQGIAKQKPVVETLLPIGNLESESTATEADATTDYEFLPSPEEILGEIVPASFKARLFKCFLDAAVSEQVFRMVAMKGATESANDMIKSLKQRYNRARQSQITSELSEIIGGAAALE
ncbi:ATP synthase F1, gamma subunit [Planctopirus limnophila DSM 3776]|uniref:ATP synthase gamma chain n=1 Tax=Planctopirus limnophila (strain ATCC 43296 / DSM 3776 / IFAM 1008 / Mu 290) TaxID=521674 RepID=D5SNA0_PLAL2|nr:ATP synthase F1 subunit gamma [Planctopirus limnophila]ADG66027.1 ATP synthase F1, gamma subunit [Planctopirus limnophila DSM 3776]